jgi:hypothetical protein
MADISIVSQLAAGDVTNRGLRKSACLAAKHFAELGKEGAQIGHSLSFFITEAISSKSKTAHLPLLCARSP